MTPIISPIDLLVNYRDASAFTMHQIHQLTDKLFQERRVQFSRLGCMWEKIRNTAELLFFESIDILWEFVALKRDYEPPPR